MGLSDKKKKRNKKTYQKIILKICQLKTNNYDIIFNLSQNEIEFAESFMKKHKLRKDDLIIGINTGGGTRWKNKVWPINKYFTLIDMLGKRLKAKILLFGGKNERRIIEHLIKERHDFLIDTGLNSIRNFAALISICNILVTGDTLALHIAVALKKKVVVLFGPTSANEIELYGRGIKIVSPLDCICCYLPDCNRKPNCMEVIKPETVFEAIGKLLK